MIENNELSDREGSELLQIRGYILPLDGLRGIAIIMVMIAHFNQESLLKVFYPILGPILTKCAYIGGWGVTLFFVLSGFLITGILLEAKGSEGFFKNFYARRALRIFPLYYGTLIVLLFLLPLFLPGDEGTRRISTYQWRLWLYMANLPGFAEWDTSNIYMVGHFWSLAVEEHFYIVWPCLVFFFRRNSLVRICIGAILVAFAMRMLVAAGASNWTTITKIDSLAMGCILAILGRQPQMQEKILLLARRSVLILGVLLVILSFLPRVFYPDFFRILKEPIAVSYFTCLLVLSIQKQAGTLGRIASNSVLRSFGKYSYGLYIIHGVLRPALSSLIPPMWLASLTPIPLIGLAAYTVISIGVCLLIAYATWHLYENQFLKLKSRFVTAPRLLAQTQSNPLSV